MRRLELDGHARVTDLELRRRPQGRALVHRPRRNAREQLLEQHATFEAREMNPDAVVRAETEADMALWTPTDVEAVGVGELARIAIRRLWEQEESLTAAHALAADLDVDERGAPDGLEHCVFSESIPG